MIKYNFRRKNKIQMLRDYEIINTVRNNFRILYLGI